MPRILTDLSFSDWVRHLFDQPVTVPAWHWDPEADVADLSPSCVLSYATKLFEQADDLLSPYSDSQVKEGVWLLISEICSPLYALANVEIPVEDRVRCIRAIPAIFEKCFMLRCAPDPSRLQDEGVGGLKSVCFMWWDIFPLDGQPENAARREIDDACLAAMEATLKLPSAVCQESALHGLGHWCLYYRKRCRSIISQFILAHPELSPELLEYARRAMECGVQ